MNNLKQLYIDNIGIGLNNNNSYDNLDLTNNEYLVMGQKGYNNESSLDIDSS